MARAFCVVRYAFSIAARVGCSDGEAMNIEQMAREAVDACGGPDDAIPLVAAVMERFAALVRAHALEEAAKVCEKLGDSESFAPDYYVGLEIAKDRIRALKG